MAKGKIVYYLDGVTPTEYVFERNFKFGHVVGRLDLVSRKRALNGAAYSDKGPVKKTFSLEFTGCPDTQKEAFEAAFDSGYALDFYLDSSETAPTAEVEFALPPDINSEAAFDANDHTWSIAVEFHET